MVLSAEARLLGAPLIDVFVMTRKENIAKNYSVLPKGFIGIKEGGGSGLGEIEKLLIKLKTLFLQDFL